MLSDEKKDVDNANNQTKKTDDHDSQPVKKRPPLDYVIERDHSRDSKK
jgi:hypothetical protein